MKKYIVLLLALVMNVAAWAGEGDGSFENPYEFTIGDNKEFVADKWYKYEPESSIKLIFTAVEGVEWTGGVYYDEEWCDVDLSNEEDENIYTFMRNYTYYLKFNEGVTLNVTRPDENEVTANMQITSAGVATFCAPFDVTIPAGVEAYTASIGGANEYVILTKIEDDVIGAGTPVVLIGNECEQDFNGIPVVEDADGVYLKGNLKEPTTVTDYAGNYVLQNGSDGVGWYAVRTAGIIVGKNRCYLCGDGGYNAKGFIGMSFDDDPTAIQQIATKAKTKADGKYLVNGKLVVVKSGNAYDIDGRLIK